MGEEKQIAVQPECARCNSSGWVCENHHDVPWADGDAGCCDGAGEPCRVCNPCDRENPPRMPPGTRTIAHEKDTPGPLNDGHYAEALDRAAIIRDMIHELLSRHLVIESIPRIADRVDALIIESDVVYEVIGQARHAHKQAGKL